MKFFKNNWYWILGIVIGLGISSIILARRNQQVAPAPDIAEHAQDSIKPQPRRVVSGGSQLNGERSPKPHTTRSKIDTFRPKVDISTLKNLETMRLPHDDIIEPSPPLPEDVLKRRNLMLQELANSGKLFERRDSGPVLSEEASQIELKALTGDMNQEDAVAFLEKHGIYNEAILNRISPHRAFKYLKTIRASYRDVNAYAEKALAENPNDSEAKKHLLLYEADNAKAAEGYREILAKEPNNISAMLSLAYRTHYDDPEEALKTLSKVHKLDPTRGFGHIGLAYERLGDVKTAWIYYRKYLSSGGQDQLIDIHMRAVERGESRYSPIHLERQTIPQIDKEQIDIDKGAVIPEETPTHVTEEMPWFPELPSLEPQPLEKQPLNKEDQKAARAEVARAEFQRQQEAAQREFNEFLKWVESIMNEESPIDTNNFLTKQLEAHLKGGKTTVEPERIVRAFEMIERYGGIKGLQRLKEKDPELAAEVERLMKEKQQPPRRNNPQNKK